MGLLGGEAPPCGSKPSDSASLRNAVSRRLRVFGLRIPAPVTSPTRRQTGNVTFGADLYSVVRQSVKCCGEYIQVPAIVCDACTLLKSNLSTEGLFRKAGSQSRQKQMKRIVDAGGKLDESCYAVDIAVLLKSYLRSLPEPIMDESMQELLLRCLLLPENDRLCAIQLALLLLPVPHLHVLHYTMEFFKCVSLKSNVNKMDANNLAVVLAPTLMPPPLSCPPQRLKHHVKLVKILIENPGIIGKIPDDLCLNEEPKEVQKKKKRRSGSLTRMLTGLKKMVTNSTGNSKSSSSETLATPIIDKNQKRKQLEAQGFSAKKRKEILENLPIRALPSTPVHPVIEKQHKRLRLSIGRKAKEKTAKDNRDSKENKYCGVLDKLEKSNKDFNMQQLTSENLMEVDVPDDKDYVKISKSEYEAIKNRVSAIENRLSQEFGVMTGIDLIEPVHQVQTAYEKTLEEAAMLSSPGSEQIARRLSRELKIRQSGEHKIIRSPSARKIGTIRRRSRENATKLIRTQTWSVSSYNDANKSTHLYPSANLKRGRPNTVHTGLLQPQVSETKRRSSVYSNENFTSMDRSKRPSSFHGRIESERPPTNTEESVENDNDAKNSQWRTAQNFLSDMDSLENPLTGRASVAKLRSQMAGTVLAKARLFDGLTDSESSLEKKLPHKPVRQASVFARKSRKCASPDKQNIPEEISPVLNTKLSRRAPYKSPGYVSKRHKNAKIAKPQSPNLNLSSQIKDVIYDICTPMSEKLNIETYQNALPRVKDVTFKNNESKVSCRGTPNLKKSLNARLTRGAKTPQAPNVADKNKINTPMRANHITPRRQSPRLQSIKTRQLI